MLIETVSVVFLYFLLMNQARLKDFDSYKANLQTIATFIHQNFLIQVQLALKKLAGTKENVHPSTEIFVP